MRRFAHSWTTTIAKLGFRKRRRTSAHRAASHGRPLRMESLESRLVFSTVPLSELPILHSAPQFDKKILLDFDGQLITDTSWGGSIHSQSLDIDDNPFSFNNVELTQIYEIWKQVSEDFAPFQVDVTTEDPGDEYFAQPGNGLRVMFSTRTDSAELGGTGSQWYTDPAGGVAHSNSWYNDDHATVWVFRRDPLAPYDTLGISGTASHESGHAFGLAHDGFLTFPYYGGHGTGNTSWGPIMGSSTSPTLSQWSKGEYPDANNQQDDLDILADELSYLSDDHTNAISLTGSPLPTALAQNGEFFFGSGIIEQSDEGSGNNDIDVFSFSTGTGDSRLVFDILPQELGPNLDIRAELYDSTGTLLSAFSTDPTLGNPIDEIGVHFGINVPAGTYMLVVDGVGKDPVTGHPGYSDYGSLGNFTIRGLVQLRGDYNHDHVVNTSDFSLWTTTYGSTTVLFADGDNDGVVDDDDYDIWYDHQGATADPPETLVVSTLVDENDGIYAPGDLSLREAIAWAAALSGDDTIEFDSALFESGPGTITLTYDGADAGTVTDELLIDSNLTIMGPGADLLVIDGNSETRVLRINSGKTAAINGLTITGGSSTAGGGVYTFGDLTMDGVRVTGNVSSNDGGGIFVYDSLVLTNSEVNGNDAADAGGGIYVNNSAYATMIDTTIDSNVATFGGGVFGYLAAGERLQIQNSTISNNTTSSTGGGITISAATGSNTYVSIVNSTISGNSSSSSGGLRVRYGAANVEIVNTTITDNQGNDGGGIRTLDGAHVTLLNSIVAENVNNSSADSDIYGSIESASSYNLIGRGGSGGLSNGTNGNIVLTAGNYARLAPLGKYGGPTKTHLLLDTSPAIDAGDPAAEAGQGGIPEFDQRGSVIDRVLDGPDVDTTARIDIGALEWN
jgi:hypothetical protein